MAKTKQPEKKEPEEKKTYTAEEHNYTMIMDRIMTWHTLSLNRSIKERDPVNLIDAAEGLGHMLRNPKVQDFLKSIYAKPEKPEEDKAGDTTKPGEDDDPAGTDQS